MIAGGRERLRQAVEHTGAVVVDERGLAMQQLRRPADGGAHDDAKGPVSYTHLDVYKRQL